MSIFSCRFLNTSEITEKEFKEIFMSAKSVAKIIDMTNNSWILEFYYDENRYVVNDYLPSEFIGGKYEIVFDITNPENNYLILWHKPIKPKSVKPKMVLAKLTYLKKYKDYVIIEYKFRHVIGRSNKEKRVEQVPIKVYDDLKIIYDKDKNIIIDIYYVKSRLNSNYVIGRPFLNYQKTLELQNSKNE
jgi:hypothetical protein